MFEKIAINLLGNAIKFTPAGGYVHLSLVQQSTNLIFSVVDSGPGVDPRDHERIFQRFQRVSQPEAERQSGTGIGLALVREYCHLLKGAVRIFSRLGKGARLEVNLPIIYPLDTSSQPGATGDDISAGLLAVTQPANEDKEEPDTPEPDTPVILIVDDNEDLRTYMADLLSHRFQVLQAADGRTALQLISRYHPKVVLSDIVMPELDGMDLVAAIRANPGTEHIPIILVTGKVGHQASSEGLLAGADDYICKPFTDQELMARVEAAIRMRKLYDQLLDQKEALKEEIGLREQAEKERNLVQQQLIRASRDAGRAEVATSILHNAGNVLNSVGISVATLIGEESGQPLPLLKKISLLLESHKNNLPSFFTTPKGAAVVGALSQLSESFQTTHDIVEDELSRIAAQVEQLAVIVSEQDVFASAENLLEETDLNELVDSALELGSVNHTNEEIRIARHMDGDMPGILLDRHKVLHILFNLLKNAYEAFGETSTDKVVEIRTSPARDSLTVEIMDNGMGIEADIVNNIFNSGFSTKVRGNGFGLHASANLARQMGGKLSFFSAGPGKGATFTLWLPLLKGETPPPVESAFTDDVQRESLV